MHMCAAVVVLALSQHMGSAAAPGRQAPLMGYSNWNMFHNNIYASLWRRRSS